MSEHLFSESNLYVTQYCGPEGPADRRRWQFTVAARYPDTQYTSLDADQARFLLKVLQRSLDAKPAATDAPPPAAPSL